MKEKKLERIGKATYLRLEKFAEMEIPICNFLNSLGVAVDEFDRTYEDVSDELIFGSNESWNVFLVGTARYVHLILEPKQDKETRLASQIDKFFPA